MHYIISDYNLYVKYDKILVLNNTSSIEVRAKEIALTYFFNQLKSFYDYVCILPQSLV